MLLSVSLFIYGLRKGIKSVTLLFILVCYFNYFVYKLDLPIFLSWSREFISLALFISIIYYIPYKLPGREIRKLLNLIVVIILFHIISSSINTLPIKNLINSFRVYYIYPLLFFAINILPVNEKYYHKLIKLVIFTALIQFPISIVQYLVFVRADHVGGLIGASGVISIIGVSFIFLGYYLYNYYRKHKIYIIASIGMFITLILAESKIGMILLPLALIYNSYIERKHKFRKVIFAVLISMLLIIMIYPFYDYINSLKLNYGPHMEILSTDPQYFFERYSRQYTYESYKSIESRDPWETGRWRPQTGRLGSAAFAAYHINKEPKNLLFGYGPGEASSSTLTIGGLRYIGFYRTYFAMLLLEWGIIGSILWLLFLIYIYKINLKCLLYFRKRPEKSIWKSFCYSSNMFNFVMIIGLFYNTAILNEYIGLFFWVINGLMFWYYNKIINNRIHT
jgi:hypothetical protein